MAANPTAGTHVTGLVWLQRARQLLRRAMNRHLLPKARLGAAQYWPPLENRVSNFKLTVLSRQEEFLSGTGTIGKLRFSSFAFYVRFACQNHFGTCKFEKGVTRITKMLKLWIRTGSTI